MPDQSAALPRASWDVPNRALGRIVMTRAAAIVARYRNHRNSLIFVNLAAPSSIAFACRTSL
jgi:hypothetical protein